MEYSIDEKIKYYEQKQKDLVAGRPLHEPTAIRKYLWTGKRLSNLRNQKRQLKK